MQRATDYTLLIQFDEIGNVHLKMVVRLSICNVSCICSTKYMHIKQEMSFKKTASDKKKKKTNNTRLSTCT